MHHRSPIRFAAGLLVFAAAGAAAPAWAQEFTRTYTIPGSASFTYTEQELSAETQFNIAEMEAKGCAVFWSWTGWSKECIEQVLWSAAYVDAMKAAGCPQETFWYEGTLYWYSVVPSFTAEDRGTFFRDDVPTFASVSMALILKCDYYRPSISPTPSPTPMPSPTPTPSYEYDYGDY